MQCTEELLFGPQNATAQGKWRGSYIAPVYQINQHSRIIAVDVPQDVSTCGNCSQLRMSARKKAGMAAEVNPEHGRDDDDVELIFCDM